ILLHTQILTLRVHLSNGDLTLRWCTRGDGSESNRFAEDLPFRAYEYNRVAAHGGSGGASHHFRRRFPADLHYGLGERAAPLVLTGRRFRLEAVDALGYDPTRSDPLYKVVPMYITLDATSGAAHGIYYDSLAAGSLDLGAEIDALWGSYTVYRADAGPLDYYVFYGPSVEKCVETYASIVGRPAPPPRYALGYLASAMGYAEAENAQELIEAFPALCASHGIPCDVLHLSSGYTVDPANGARNVFTWNRTRFPDPQRMFQKLEQAGIKTVVNVKPWLLSCHPMYNQLAKERGFVWNPETNSPSTTRLWSAGEGTTTTGSYIDLTSPTGRAFWKREATHLLSLGAAGIWNDNNEMNIQDDLHTLAGAGPVGLVGRTLNTLHMAMASYEAMVEFDAGKRPFLISRAGAPGVQRFACQSWSGDNVSAWGTLRHNVAMGLNMGLSLFSGYGHDVGGFVGPRPSPELFVRWVQNGIFHPRFCIHSWKAEGITEPWMYPEVGGRYNFK
ncbi:glycosyl hydrolases family 31-domain-containing protein, partial [Blyttiomyces helicus]